MTTETKATYTPEPWRVEEWGGGIEVAEGDTVFSICEVAPYPEARNAGVASEDEVARGRANARRIVAAINALAGIPTEAIEGGVIKELLDAAEAAYDDYGERGVAHIWMPLGEALRKAGRIR